jgi:mutator protein MutT
MPDGIQVPVLPVETATMTSDRVAIVVLAAVIERDGRFLVTRRLEGTHLSGFWEFPGGKCEPGESHDACLRRELTEELGVDAEVGEEIVVTGHAYPDRTVRLHFRRCRLIGEPRALLGQEVRWVTRPEMKDLPFPEADRALIELLTRP